MPEILDLATSFKAKSQQQAADIEQTGKAALTELERRWKAALSASGKRMADDIQSHNAKIQRALLWSWAGPVVVGIVCTAVLWVLIAYQGHRLAKTWSEADRAQAAYLEERGTAIYECGALKQICAPVVVGQQFKGPDGRTLMIVEGAR